MRRGGHAAAVPVCWTLDFRWNAVCIRTQLTIRILQIRLASTVQECNNYVSRGVYVLGGEFKLGSDIDGFPVLTFTGQKF
jgi:hypothetical protein